MSVTPPTNPSVNQLAAEIAEHEIARRTGWFRPFCLAVLILILVNTCVVGGAIVLLVRQIVTIPPGLISALTGGPAPNIIQATTVLDKIQALSQLTVTKFSYSSLVTSERDLPGMLQTLYGDKLVMIAVGHVNAGIDLRQVTNEAVSGNTSAMTIRLPAPVLLDCFLDEGASYVVSRDTGLFAKPAPNLDQEARQYADKQFRDNALKDGILDQVQTNAQTLVMAFVSNLGVKQVTVLTTPPDPNAPQPDSCK